MQKLVYGQSMTASHIIRSSVLYATLTVDFSVSFVDVVENYHFTLTSPIGYTKVK
jgi:hypothetical protein